MKHFSKNIKKFLYAIALFSGVAVSTSCEHKPLYVLDDTPRTVRLIFDWQNLRPNDTKPEGMHIAFIGDDKDASVLEYEVPTITGLVTKLQPMEYIITGHSNDIPEIIATPTDNDVEIKILEPDQDVPAIYAVNQEELVENPTSEDGSDVQTIVAKPYPLNCIYSIKVLNTDILPDSKEWTGILSGLTDAVMLSNGKSSATANEVIRAFVLNCSDAPTNHTATISVLGKLNGKPNILRLRAKKADGTYAIYEIDVTSQIDNAPDFRNVEIVINLKDYESKPDGGNGSIDPSVDEFPDISEDITL